MANKDKKDVVIGCATYEGETKNGMKHGMGTLTWDDGDQYVGEFKNDEKTNGTFRWRGGDTYTGEWKQSLMHGRGTYTYKNRRTYEGEWVQGYKQGYGIFTWPIGDRYEGQFHKDQCHGVGIMSYADGRVYKGQWAENKKHGFGTMKLANGDQIQASWVENSLNGMAIYTEASGVRVEEFYRDGKLANQRKPLKRRAEDIDALLQATEPPAWASDSDYKSCFHCNTAFTLVNRRHHCRHWFDPFPARHRFALSFLFQLLVNPFPVPELLLVSFPNELVILTLYPITAALCFAEAAPARRLCASEWALLSLSACATSAT
eukprot:TRINITY_DN680_c0_g1_i1.p1 TRINITY_DN680_c0_g1~~TRINITY_DN680_c0_g1_i1.p1  ORF type:complete len:318 (-),score=57.23 TRINITY_DN680_c0_g1_i1:298-1251(-)